MSAEIPTPVCPDGTRASAVIRVGAINAGLYPTVDDRPEGAERHREAGM
jgi:hypothetical protein